MIFRCGLHKGGYVFTPVHFLDVKTTKLISTIFGGSTSDELRKKNLQNVGTNLDKIAAPGFFFLIFFDVAKGQAGPNCF